MKKILNVVLCIGILLQNFIFVIPVIASEVDDETKLEIVSIKQGEEELELKENKYVLKNYQTASLVYELTNYDENKNYSIKIEEENKYGGSSYQINYKGKDSIQLNITSTYKISACSNDYECSIVYDTFDIVFDNQLYENINNSYIYIESVYQGGKEITPDVSEWTKTANFEFNDLEKITYKVKGVNLQEDAYYDLSTNGFDSYDIGNNLLGSDLNDGYEFSFYPSLTQPTDFLLLREDYVVNNILYNNNDEYFEVYNNYIEDNTVENFDFDLIYTNYKDVDVNEAPEPFNGMDIVSSKYHDKNNSLSINIKGNEFYVNENYDVTIEGYSDNEKTYEKNFILSGEEISAGVLYELEDYVLSYITEYEVYDINNRLHITIGDVKKEIDIYYTSQENLPQISSNIYFENGKKNLSTFRGNGSINWMSGIADTNKSAFTKYSSIYINYIGDNFNDNEEYEYVLEYGYLEEKYDTGSKYYFTKELDSGTITGLKLNTIGMTFRVDNNQNYQMPAYRFAIKKGEEIIYYQMPVLSLVNSPTLANVSMKVNNKNLYLQTSDMSYIATRNHPIDIEISGLGFDENKEYDFDYCYYVDDIQTEKCEKISINGKDINNGTGTAKIQFNEKLPDTVSKINFYVYLEPSDEQYNDNVAIQGGFEVTLVNSEDYFDNLSEYVLDNTGDFIKNITKLTSVKDFTNSLNIVDNGKVKIFDHTGTKEINDTIGTGMIARIINEYDENVLDLDVVVKGDVTGDGNISITDLVKVKRHLSKNDELTGVYETAGNVTDTGKIGITDLVKISRDVAKIQEVK